MKRHGRMSAQADLLHQTPNRATAGLLDDAALSIRAWPGSFSSKSSLPLSLSLLSSSEERKRRSKRDYTLCLVACWVGLADVLVVVVAVSSNRRES
jgi:hypothetical protein